MLKGIINWGGLTFALAMVWLGAGVLLSFQFSLSGFPLVYADYLPKLNSGLALFLVFLCQISYGRIHNARIYILGILMGLNALVENSQYTGLKIIALPPDINLYFQLFLLVLLLLVCLLPTSLKFSSVKKITLSLIVLYATGFLLWEGALDNIVQVFFNPAGEPYPVYQMIGFGSPIFYTGLTVLFLRNQFYLGGMFAGLSVLLSSIWLREYYLADANTYYLVGSSMSLLYIALGVVIHWIAKVSHNIAIDPLMEIYNRSYCNNIINEQSSVNTSPPFSVIMVDIDHFKKVNDVHGHQAGDVVLKKVAQTLKISLGSKGVLCRYGGEEIIIFISHTSQKQAEIMIEKARLAVKKLRVKIGRKSLKVTISAGISERLKKAQSVETVILAADKAVYKAKKAGRDRVRTLMANSRKK